VTLESATIDRTNRYNSSSKQNSMPSHDDLMTSTTRIEGSILETVTSSSKSIEEDIKILAEQLEQTKLNTPQQTLTDFINSNRDVFENMSNRLDTIIRQNSNFQTLADERHVSDARQKILDSLYFSQMRDRQNQIHQAHEETFQWVLQPMPQENQRWDDFMQWLGAIEEKRNVYWIYGKPGSGKSTLMRFLDEKINSSAAMLPWAQNGKLLRAHYFFWNPGSDLQKSLTGLLRSVLVQLLRQMPSLIPVIVGQQRWNAAETSGDHSYDWTNSELQSALHEYILRIHDSAKVFLLIDGLDELEGSDEKREELVTILNKLVSLGNVKICLSSRPWNIFWDAFGRYPQLRLEDLTHTDIKDYVQAQLESHARFRYLLEHDRITAENIVEGVTSKASGVFLWVRLVVRELLNGLRDGDGVSTLSEKLEQIPADLNEYFARFLDSISHQYRREASAMLQIALHRQTDFVTVHPLRLIDLSFMEEKEPNFALTGQYSFRDLDLADLEATRFRLDSSVRRVNSRCMGLLECQFDSASYSPYSTLHDSTDEDRIDQAFEPIIYPETFAALDRLNMFGLTVKFLHRSCRDFLLTPSTQSLLHEYTRGPYDVASFLCNARLTQLVALSKAGENGDFAVGIASYVLSALSSLSCRQYPSIATAMMILEPAIKVLASTYLQSSSDITWYIGPILASWQEEKSTCLTLAIDFELRQYVRTFLTLQSVQHKLERPILDYILRPRFAGTTQHLKIGNRRPNLEFLYTTLKLGGDPNQTYGGISVWALFLCYLRDIFGTCTCRITHEDKTIYIEAIRMLILTGASPVLPSSWLSELGFYHSYTDIWEGLSYWVPGAMLDYRWPRVQPITGGCVNNRCEPYFAVSDLLEHFRPEFGSSVDHLKNLLDNSVGRQIAYSLCSC
jgi:hypothetical protein